MMRSPLIASLALGAVTLFAATAAYALPQFAIRSVRACDTCHIEPTGWVDPDVALRKCSLNCNVCHINPNGGGMRNESGIFYGRRTLPRWGKLAANHIELSLKLRQRPAPTTQPWNPVPSTQPIYYGDDAAGSQPTSAPTSQPMQAPSSQAMQAPSSQAMQAPSSQAMQAPSSQAMQAPSSQAAMPSSQPSSGPTSQPAGSQPTASAASSGKRERLLVPAPGTSFRYAGITPHPDFQLGTDIRLAYFDPFMDDTRDAAFFPMQTDLYLAYRPYNPDQLNEGRVTLLASMGSLGSRAEEFDNFTDRFFVRELYAMYHDLPNQMYVRAGRFLPTFGWRTDDHSPFVRQSQKFMGAGFDHEREVTGVEVGLNPNYPYVHFSVFNAATEWDKPYDADAGFGTMLSAGYRDLGWHLGGSLAYGDRDRNAAEGNQLMASLQWAVNLWFTSALPLIYFGEFVLNHSAPDVGDSGVGLAAFHELGWMFAEGYNFTARYDWADGDIDFRDDTSHRASLGIEFYPVQFLEVILRYRHNWTYTDERFAFDADELLLMLHGWY